MTQESFLNNQSETHGKTFTSQKSTTNPAGIHVKTKSQARQIRQWQQSRWQAKHSARSGKNWTQIVREKNRKGEGAILEENFSGSHKCPIDLIKLYPNGFDVFLSPEATGTAVQTLSPEDSRMAFYENPAHEETIMALLARLAMLKPPRGMKELERAYVLKDYTSRLLFHKAKEIDLFEAIENIVETDPSDFFPNYQKLHRRIFDAPEDKRNE